ncbi:phage integrase family protein (plasmid) [Acidisarcina polymorpha]|uniref:Phage integrase family protein n=2 Tax=Acidisarcina polymorpha TaxID=2211140 RepID=A0A2Z5GC02_9BACT|nr:tyrosine-type recombinase/integrase [Acidisarcina polymorpha]AXC16450.1 phage integrase family protein [Acidisarcina polymorpha]
MTAELEIELQPAGNRPSEAFLIDLVVNGVTSEHSRRSYKTGLKAFFTWIRLSGAGRAFTKALVQQYRSSLLDQGLSASTVNLRLSPIRKLAREMADNQLLDPAAAAAIERVPGIEKRGNRAGNWLMKEQANDLLNAPSPKTLPGIRDRAVLALLLGCGLRRAELLRINIEDLQQREGRWVLPDMAGKGGRVRTVTVPAGVKSRIDAWLCASGISQGRLFRPVTKAGVLAGEEIRDEKAVWRLVMRYAKTSGLGKLAPHDLRRTCAKLCRKAGGELEQIQLLLGHASIQTTERYLGTEQALAHAVNDAIGLDIA